MSYFSDFGSQLIEWWKKEGRRFPWRNTDDPFRIFLAEVLLHRTRAENVAPIYQNLIENFTSPDKLAGIDENELRSILSPLGLRWRIDKLLVSIRMMVSNFDGRVPMGRAQLLSLPGVGDYIASATRVFTLNSDDPLIDTNTVRVISRVYGFKVTESTRRKKAVRYKYSTLRNNSDPRTFGFSMIDLASLICRSHLPDCRRCPVLKFCSTGHAILSFTLHQ